MEELHQCSDPLSPLYYKRYSSSDSNLKGKFVTKWEPRFWVEVVPWIHDEKKNVLLKAGWGSSDKEKQQMYTELPYSLIYPFGKTDYSGVTVSIPAKSYQVLEARFGPDWKVIKPPSYYQPHLEWGSEEMKAIKDK